MRIPLLSLGLLPFFALLATSSPAATVVLPFTSGTYEYIAPPAPGGGTRTDGDFYAGTRGNGFGGTNIYHNYFSLDLSGIPADQSITDISFTRTGAFPVGPPLTLRLWSTTSTPAELAAPGYTTAKFDSLSGGTLYGSGSPVTDTGNPSLVNYAIAGNSDFLQFLNAHRGEVIAVGMDGVGGRIDGGTSSFTATTVTVPEPGAVGLLLAAVGIVGGGGRFRGRLATHRR